MKKQKKKDKKVEIEFGAIITNAGSSLKNKTGSWRTLKPIVTDKCKACGICMKFCPDGAITIVNGKARINYDYCKGCGICVLECPNKAVFMQKEEK